MSEPEEVEEWDEDTVIELRRYALEQALMAHMHGRAAQIDPEALFKLADRFVNYVLGEQNP